MNVKKKIPFTCVSRFFYIFLHFFNCIYLSESVFFFAFYLNFLFKIRYCLPVHTFHIFTNKLVNKTFYVCACLLNFFCTGVSRFFLFTILHFFQNNLLLFICFLVALYFSNLLQEIVFPIRYIHFVKKKPLFYMGVL